MPGSHDSAVDKMETPGNDSSSPHSGGAVGAKRKKTMAAQPVESLPEIEHILTQHMDMDDGDNTDGSGKCRMIMRCIIMHVCWA